MNALDHATNDSIREVILRYMSKRKNGIVYASDSEEDKENATAENLFQTVDTNKCDYSSKSLLSDEFIKQTMSRMLQPCKPWH